MRYHAPHLFVSVAVVVLLGSAACQPRAVESVGPVAPPDWRLVWADEFERDGLPDSTKWSYDVGGHGWGNNELQHYTDSRLENARVADGRLIIEARQDSVEGRAYSSARLVTKHKGDWLYGRVEARARLPSGRGTWPAIWMLPTEWRYGGWPESGEIDIMEHVGFNPDVVLSTVHTGAYNHVQGTQVGDSLVVPTARTDYHVYAIEWTPADIRAYIDGTHFFTFPNERLTDPAATHREWPFDQPFHLVMNVAVGGNWGGAHGVDPDIWPQRMEVDYVRVYQRED